MNSDLNYGRTYVFLKFLISNNFSDDETIFVNNEPTENSFNDEDLNSIESELTEEFQEVKHSKTRRMVGNFKFKDFTSYF